MIIIFFFLFIVFSELSIPPKCIIPVGKKKKSQKRNQEKIFSFSGNLSFLPENSKAPLTAPNSLRMSRYARLQTTSYRGQKIYIFHLLESSKSLR